MQEVIDNDGALLYIWPLGNYHYLMDWIRLGGKKVIVIGEFNPNYIAIQNYLDNGYCVIDMNDIDMTDPKYIELDDQGLLVDINDIEPMCPYFPPKEHMDVTWKQSHVNIDGYDDVYDVCLFNEIIQQ